MNKEKESDTVWIGEGGEKYNKNELKETDAMEDCEKR